VRLLSMATKGATMQAALTKPAACRGRETSSAQPSMFGVVDYPRTTGPRTKT
jgi:hypothetical protein